MAERPDLRLVPDPEDGPEACGTCGQPATTHSAVDGAPLCTKCFTETHWHPSWSRTFEDVTDPAD